MKITCQQLFANFQTIIHQKNRLENNLTKLSANISTFPDIKPKLIKLNQEINTLYQLLTNLRYSKYDLQKNLRIPNILPDFHASKIAANPADPNTYIIGARDGRIVSFNTNLGLEKNCIYNFSNNISVIKFSPDNNMFAISDYDNLAVIFDAKTHTSISKFRPLKVILSVDFDPTSNLFISGGVGEKGYINLWEINSGKKINSIDMPTSSFSVNFHPNGRLFASGDEDTFIRIYNLDSKSPVRTFEHGSRVQSVRYNHQGNIIASAGFYDIKTWNIRTGKLISSIPKAHKRVIETLYFTNNDQVLISSSHDNHLKFWNPYTGKLIHKIAGPKEGCMRSACYLPEEEKIITTIENNIYIWGMDNDKNRHNLLGRIISYFKKIIPKS